MVRMMEELNEYLRSMPWLMFMIIYMIGMVFEIYISFE